MKVKFWRRNPSEEYQNSPVAEFIKDLRQRDPELWTLVEAHMRRADIPEVPLDEFRRQGLAKKMIDSGSSSLYEFRFPANYRKKGTARIYFCFDRVVRNQIWLLSAELKTEKDRKKKKKGNSTAIKVAIDRCSDIR